MVKHHGVPFLGTKQASLVVNKSNKNDIKKILDAFPEGKILKN